MPLTRLKEHGDIVVVRTTLKLKTGREPGGLIYLCPDRIPDNPEVLFLANGFAANHKTFTFRPRIPEGGYSDSFADTMAKWGYIVVIKDVGSERTRIEPTFEDHMAHVPHYAETALRVVADELPRFLGGREVTLPGGVHWIGHSMGGMEVMAAENRAFIHSFTAIASPTYMASGDAHTEQLARVFGGMLGVRDKFAHIPVSAGLLSKVTDAMFKALQVESGRDLSEFQEVFVRTMARRPFVNLVVHNFLNLEHLDLETAVAFFRTGLSDETLHLMNEFALAIMQGDRDKDHVLGHPIKRLGIPTMVMSGRGDHIAPVMSCENLLRFVDNPLKRHVYFEKYDHLGLMVRYGAENDVWPHILLFLKEMRLQNGAPRAAAARDARDTARFLLDNLALGIEARNYARELLAHAEAQLEPAREKYAGSAKKKTTKKKHASKKESTRK